MKIAAIRERAQGEYRTAITPDTAKLYTSKGFKVFVEKGIGLASNFADEEYTAAGALLSNVPLEILSDANLILKVQPSPILEDKINEIDLASSNACIIGLLKPHQSKEYISKAINKKLSLVAMEMVPRTTIAQSMDALSSQSNLAGYRAVLEAAYYFGKAFPMMMTAAGTVAPAKVLVIGVGVAGLQAIATAKRLGAVVSSYDVRLAAKEQTESLGAKFIHPAINSMQNSEDGKGYASEVSKDFAELQEKFLGMNISKFDIVITTAQIPGKKAPLLITAQMLKSMQIGSVIVDMATETGGNVDGSVMDKVISKDGVRIVGWSNMAAKIPHDASKLYAKNLYNLINHAIKSDGVGKMQIDFNNPLLKEMIISS